MLGFSAVDAAPPFAFAFALPPFSRSSSVGGSAPAGLNVFLFAFFFSASFVASLSFAIGVVGRLPLPGPGDAGRLPGRLAGLLPARLAGRLLVCAPGLGDWMGVAGLRLDACLLPGF